MWRWIAKQYSRRIVNVNVNIVVAGMAAMALATIPVRIARWAGMQNESAIGVLYAVCDFILDLFLVILLHWLANHWPRKWKHSQQLVASADKLVEQAGPPPLPFLKDTTIIQTQRACLSPVLYASYGLLFLPIMFDQIASHELACFVAMLCAVLVVRVLHTFWMLSDERRWRRKWEQTVAARGLAPGLGGVPTTSAAGIGSAGHEGASDRNGHVLAREGDAARSLPPTPHV